MRKAKVLEIENKEQVTIGDAMLAYQMGYRAEVNNGQLVEFIKEDK